MKTTDLLLDAFGRIREEVADDRRRARARSSWPTGAGPGANSIAWLVWHLTRVQDNHVAEVAGSEQVWTARRLGRAVRAAVGPGRHRLRPQRRARSARCGPTAELLVGYHDAVHERTLGYVAALDDGGARPGRRRALGPAGHPRRPAASASSATTWPAPRPGRSSSGACSSAYDATLPRAGRLTSGR